MTHAQFADVKQRVTIVEVFNHYVPEEKRSNYQAQYKRSCHEVPYKSLLIIQHQRLSNRFAAVRV